jgi:hypothetical protein
MPPSPSPPSTAHRTHRAPQRPQMSWHSTPAGCRAACALAMWRRRVPRRDHSTAPTGSCQRTGSYCRHGGRRELRGRTRTGLVHMHRRGGRGGRLAVARMCRARQPGRVDCTSRAAGERGGAVCRWRGIGGKGAVQHGADWRAVSVNELDCVRSTVCPVRGRAQGEWWAATLAASPKGPIFHTHVMLHIGATMSHRVLCPLRCEIRGQCAGGDTITI